MQVSDQINIIILLLTKIEIGYQIYIYANKIYKYFFNINELKIIIDT